MDYLMPTEAIEGMDLSPSPNRTPENVEQDNNIQKASMSRLARRDAQREAQRDFRRRQKERRQLEEQMIADQTREINKYQTMLEIQRKELEREKQARQGLEHQVQRLEAKIVQLERSANIWAENSMILHGSVKALQLSPGSLCGDSKAICHNGNHSRADSMTLSDSTSQLSLEAPVPPGKIPIFSKFHRKEQQLRRIISPISPEVPIIERRVTHKGSLLSPASPSPLNRGNWDRKVGVNHRALRRDDVLLRDVAEIGVPKD